MNGTKQAFVGLRLLQHIRIIQPSKVCLTDVVMVQRDHTATFLMLAFQLSPLRSETKFFCSIFLALLYDMAT